MVQAIHQTTEILQLLFDFRWSMPLLCRVVQVLRCCCGEDLGAPTVAARWEICALLRSSVFGSHLFGVRLWSTGYWTFLGDDIRNVSIFSAYWFDTGYMSASVYGGFWKIFTYFLCQDGPRIPKLSHAWFDSGSGR